MDDGKKKFVRFDLYCTTCVFEKKTANQEPCDTCLTVPAREFSQKPECYEEKEKK